MVGLVSSEVCETTFNATKQNNKFQLFTDTFDQFSFAEIKMNLMRSSVFQILHPIIFNKKKQDHLVLKPIRNKDQKIQALMLILYS